MNFQCSNDQLQILPLRIKGKKLTFTVPSSKSIANRALILAALINGEFRINGDFQAEDIQLMIAALKKLGIRIRQEKESILAVNDLSWRKKTNPITLFVGNSGTCMRFLTSLVAFRKGTTVLSGVKRMEERPIKDLVDALRQLDIKIEYMKNRGFPPLKVFGKGEVEGGKVVMKNDVSSQFISSLLLIGAAFEKGLEIIIKGKLISASYLDVTIQVLADFGISVKHPNSKSFFIFPTSNQKPATSNRKPETNYQIPGDASSAVYWWALGFLHGAKVNVTNVPRNTKQPDYKFKELLEHLNHKRKINMSSMPDASIMLMALAPILSHPITITGLVTLRVKETDRIKAMATELRKLGVHVKTGKDWMRISRCEPRTRALVLGEESAVHSQKLISIDTYNDHRIAMSMAILGTKLGNLSIKNPECVNKTYPGFWKQLSNI